MANQTTLFYEKCRLCLDNRGSLNIVDDHNDLQRDIFIHAGVKVKVKDNLPQKVCTICLDIIKKAKDLRRVALKNDCYLRILFEDEVGNDSEQSNACTVILNNEENRNQNNNHSKICEQCNEINNLSPIQSSEKMLRISVRKDLFLTSTPQPEPPRKDLPIQEINLTDPPTQPSQTKPSSNPPQTEPPSSNPPQKEPPSSKPPQTEHPSSKPPQTESPSSNPPQTEPPSSKPPQTEPPPSKAFQTEPLSSKPRQIEPLPSKPSQTEQHSSELPQQKPSSISPEQQPSTSADSSHCACVSSSSSVKKKKKKSKRKRRKSMEENIESNTKTQGISFKVKLVEPYKHRGLKVKIKRANRLDFECDVCSKNFETHKKLYLHQRQHNKNILCPIDVCGKKFPSKADLAKHVRTHTGEKPYKCDICEKAFTQGGSLKQHKENVHFEFSK